MDLNPSDYPILTLQDVLKLKQHNKFLDYGTSRYAATISINDIEREVIYKKVGLNYIPIVDMTRGANNYRITQERAPSVITDENLDDVLAHFGVPSNHQKTLELKTA